MKNFKKNQFTLLELLVAMAVFSVMMGVLMQFFSSAQKATVNTRKNTAKFEDTRLVFDMIAKDLQSSFYVKDAPIQTSSPNTGISFWSNNTPSNNSIISSLSFFTKSPFSEVSNKRALVTFHYNSSANTLEYYNNTEVFVFDESGTLQEIDPETPHVLAENIEGFNVSSTGGDEFMPTNITIELKVPSDGNVDDDDTNNLTFAKSFYIGGRRQ